MNHWFLIAVALLAMSLPKSSEATFWFKTTGTATSLGNCGGENLPLTDNGWCNQYSPAILIPGLQPKLFLGDSGSEWSFIWPLVQNDPQAIFNISGVWNTPSNPSYGSINVTSEFREKVLISSLEVNIASPVILQLTASEVILENVRLMGTQDLIFDELYEMADYNISISKMKMTYSASAIAFPSLGYVHQLSIKDSKFEQVGNYQGPPQPIFSIGASFPAEYVLLDNLAFSAPTASYRSTFPYLLSINAKKVDIRGVNMTEMATTPIQFLEAANLTIANSYFSYLEYAPAYGCWKCNQDPVENYTHFSGVAMKIFGSNLNPPPAVLLRSNTFIGVSAFFNADGSPGVLEAPHFDDNYFTYCGIQAASSFPYHIKLTFNAITHRPTGLGYDSELFPSLLVRGDFYSHNNDISGAHSPMGGSLCLTIFDNSVMVGGWIQPVRTCISGNLTLHSTATFVGVGYLRPWNYNADSKIVIKDSGSVQLHSSTIDGIGIVGEPGSQVSVYLSYPASQYFNALFNGAFIDVDYIYPLIDRALTGVEPGFTLAMGNGSWNSQSSSEFNFLLDQQRGYQGHLTTMGPDFVLVINQTQCLDLCQHGASCKERFASCNCSSTPEAELYGGPTCGCTLTGKPGAAQCDPSGALGWVIDRSWDLPTDKAFQVPEGYYFKINGDCILNGTLELSTNTTFVTGGTFRNSGNLTIASTLTKVDLGGGLCEISSSTTISTASVTFDPQSIVEMVFDATQLDDSSACSRLGKRDSSSTGTNAKVEFNAMSIFKAREEQLSQISLASASTSTISTNGSASVSGNWTVALTTTPTTKANITLAKSDPSTSSSSSLIVTVSTSDPNSCATTDTSTKGLLSVFVVPCSSNPTPNSKSSGVKWWWYGIPIIVIGVITIIAAIVILSVPSLKAKLLPYRN